ncbi:MAG: GNAT family N-acetyltransferase [Bacteroidota bacterium]
MLIRSFQKEDIQPLIEILRATGAFRPEEIEVAVELMNIVVEEPQQQDYIMYTAVDEAGVVRGYYCVGPTAMTLGTFDLYWIAVDPATQRKHIGTELLKHCHALVQSQQGRLIVVETSSQPKYDPTRLFYVRNGYSEEARIKDYYAAGDDLVIYTKHL